MIRLFLPLLVLLAACADDSENYPRLLPTAQILAEPVLPDHVGSAADQPMAVASDLESRAGGLRGRAEDLRGPVIEPEFRGQMNSVNALAN